MKRTYYRYLSSHWLETLRDCRFKLGEPSKYRKSDWSKTISADPLECKPQVHLQANCPQNTIIVQGREIDAQIFAENYNKAFSNPCVMDDVIRILCLSDVSKNVETDQYMWRNYASNYGGVRIGVELEIDENEVSQYPDFRGEAVRYGVNPNVIELLPSQTIDDLSEGAFQVLFTKHNDFIKESEYRLLTRHNHGLSQDGFLSLQNEMIVSLDVGVNMSREDCSQLARLWRKKYSKRPIRVAGESNAEVVYSSLVVKELPQCV